ncbi:hypothetical protein DMENIID0001_002610 [Sergentomyia squamirostris]
MRSAQWQMLFCSYPCWYPRWVYSLEHQFAPWRLYHVCVDFPEIKGGRGEFSRGKFSSTHTECIGFLLDAIENEGMVEKLLKLPQFHLTVLLWPFELKHSFHLNLGLYAIIVYYLSRRASRFE